MDLSGPGVFQLHPPRADITAREVCRSGGVLRLLQEAAVADSVRRGWDPLRYRQEQTGFIIYKARLIQRQEIPSGPAVTARTWVLDFRRGTLSRRLIHLLSSDGELLVEALQEWAHITLPELRPARAPSALLEAFSPSH